MTERDLASLALGVARCPEVARAREDRRHPCHKVVCVQSSDPHEFQIPEGWAGNLAEARICFVSSNPSISTPPSKGEERGDWGAAEDYPRAAWTPEQIADFTLNRFDGRWATPDGRHRRRDGRHAGTATPYWRVAHERASEMIANADPRTHYVMTEVVHCKSKKEKGVTQAADPCARLHMNPILEATPAPLVVVVGTKARDLVTRLWAVPEGFGRRDTVGRIESANLLKMALGGSERVVCYLAHFTGMEKVRTFEQSYPAHLENLKRLVNGHLSVEQFEIKPEPAQ